MTIKTISNPNLSRWNNLYKQKRIKTNLNLYCEICGWTGYQDSLNTIQLYHILENPFYIKPTERDEDQELLDIKQVSNSILMLCPNHLSVFNQMNKYQTYIDLLNESKKILQQENFVNDVIKVKQNIINLMFQYEIECLKKDLIKFKSNGSYLPDKIYDRPTNQYFIPTGEFRVPLLNEYYLHGIVNGHRKVVKNERDMKMNRIILIPMSEENKKIRKIIKEN